MVKAVMVLPSQLSKVKQLQALEFEAQVNAFLICITEFEKKNHIKILDR